MAGIVSGISDLAVGPCDARRRQPRAQPSPNAAANTTTPMQAQPSPNAAANTTTPKQSEEQQLNAYFNAAKQNIKGLTNQTGYIKGNANGVINLGTLTASTAQRQA